MSGMQEAESEKDTATSVQASSRLLLGALGLPLQQPGATGDP